MSTLPYRPAANTSNSSRSSARPTGPKGPTTYLETDDEAGGRGKSRVKEWKKRPLQDLDTIARNFLNQNTESPSSLSNSADYLDQYPDLYASESVSEWRQRARSAVRSGQSALARQLLISAQLIKIWREPDAHWINNLLDLDQSAYTWFLAKIYKYYDAFFEEADHDNLLEGKRRDMLLPWENYRQPIASKSEKATESSRPVTGSDSPVKTLKAGFVPQRQPPSAFQPRQNTGHNNKYVDDDEHDDDDDDNEEEDRKLKNKNTNYVVSAGPTADIRLKPRTTTNPPRPSAPSAPSNPLARLSPLMIKFVTIGIRDLADVRDFVDKQPEIFDEELAPLQTAGIECLKQELKDAAEQIAQRLLIIKAARNAGSTSNHRVNDVTQLLSGSKRRAALRQQITLLMDLWQDNVTAAQSSARRSSLEEHQERDDSGRRSAPSVPSTGYSAPRKTTKTVR